MLLFSFLAPPTLADAIVEADPVDPKAAARRVAIAQVDPNLRRMFRPHISERAIHCARL